MAKGELARRDFERLRTMLAKGDVITSDGNGNCAQRYRETIATVRSKSGRVASVVLEVEVPFTLSGGESERIFALEKALRIDVRKLRREARKSVEFGSGKE